MNIDMNVVRDVESSDVQFQSSTVFHVFVKAESLLETEADDVKKIAFKGILINCKSIHL